MKHILTLMLLACIAVTANADSFDDFRKAWNEGGNKLSNQLLFRRNYDTFCRKIDSVQGNDYLGEPIRAINEIGFGYNCDTRYIGFDFQKAPIELTTVAMSRLNSLFNNRFDYRTFEPMMWSLYEFH